MNEGQDFEKAAREYIPNTCRAYTREYEKKTSPMFRSASSKKSKSPLTKSGNYKNSPYMDNAIKKCLSPKNGDEGEKNLSKSQH